MALTISQTGIDLIKSFEGCKLTAYWDKTGKVWTIGYGTTSGIKEGMTVTQAQAEEYLKNDCTKFANHVNTYNAKYAWVQDEFDALVSFAYNLGNINRLTANGTRSKATIASKMLEYTKSGGVVLAGLIARRQAENSLFLNGYFTRNGITYHGSKTTTAANNTENKNGGNNDIKAVQTWLNKNYNTGLTVDGINGVKTQAGLVKALQTELNAQFKAGLVVDGIWGPKTQAACVNVKRGGSGAVTKIMQGALICKGYACTFDGDYGAKTETALYNFQKAKSLSADKICGKITWQVLLT